MKNVFLLTGDIGGTNSRMALYDTRNKDCSHDNPLVVKYYRNVEVIPPDAYEDPDAFGKHVVVPFLKHCWYESGVKNLAPFDTCHLIACFAMAGAVVNNHVRMTNLNDLMVDGSAIQDNRSDPYLRRIIICRVINDFVAQGYGCLTLKAHEVKQLAGPHILSMEDLVDGPKVCVGAGTGLGECYLTRDDDSPLGHYVCYPSEGGHVEYAPRNDLEIRLWRFLSEKFSTKDRISVERVVSGRGLANVYEFLAHEFPERIRKEMHNEFLEAGDEQGKVVAVNAQKGTLCDQAVGIMMSAYGCEVGSAAIKFIPTGGLYLTGGLTPKNLHRIEDQNSEFMHSYRNKGRVSPLLDRIPLFAVLIEDLGVRGAHKAAMMEYEEFMYPTIRKVKGTKAGRILQDYAYTAMTLTAVISFFAGLFYSQKSYRFKK